MNKKKAAIDNFSSQLEPDTQEPAAKVPRYDNENAVSDSANDKGVDNATIPVETNVTVSSGKSCVEGVTISGDAGEPDLAPSQRGTADVTNKKSYLNKEIITEEITNQLNKAFSSKSDFADESTGVQMSSKPFQHCVLPNLITKADYVSDLESALLDLPLRDKNNDLYKFSQSRDLNHSKSSTISTFRTLCETIRSFISDITNIPLNSKIDLFCSQYKYTDALLCHDDELEERRIAFIYYLVPEDWSSADGGTLDLFVCDEHCQPTSIVKSILPKRNHFLFFEVSVKSFHQVAEILSEDKTRLSISGWFHGPTITRPEPYVSPLPPALPYGSIQESVFYSWLNPLYLAPDIQKDIRKRFEEDSEIELQEFLQKEKYDELVSAIKSSDINWQLLGPANKRHYFAADKSSVPRIVSEYLRVIHSDAVFLVLSNLTGLKLHSLAPLSDDEVSTSNGNCSNGDSSTTNPRCRSEVRKWEHGCYTLAHDTDSEVFDFALDSMLYIDCGEDWSFEMGGQTSYIAKGEDEELLAVAPTGNSLALVYRDKDTMRFVKHLNHRVTKLPSPRYYEINAVYYE